MEIRYSIWMNQFGKYDGLGFFEDHWGGSGSVTNLLHSFIEIIFFQIDQHTSISFMFNTKLEQHTSF
jgi:hypothetical protein